MSGKDDLIDPWSTVRETRARFPAARQVLEQYNIAAACADCTLMEAAHRARVSPSELLWALKQAALAGEKKEG